MLDARLWMVFGKKLEINVDSRKIRNFFVLVRLGVFVKVVSLKNVALLQDKRGISLQSLQGVGWGAFWQRRVRAC